MASDLAAADTKSREGLSSHSCVGYVSWLARNQSSWRVTLKDESVAMKDGIHPAYHPVIFKDASSGFAFVTRSTQSSEQMMEWTDGKSYPVITMEITSHSHPFYTGQQRMIDTQGRVDRFKKRYAR